jgi:hypothetical protein
MEVPFGVCNDMSNAVQWCTGPAGQVRHLPLFRSAIGRRRLPTCEGRTRFDLPDWLPQSVE